MIIVNFYGIIRSTIKSLFVKSIIESAAAGGNAAAALYVI